MSHWTVKLNTAWYQSDENDPTNDGGMKGLTYVDPLCAGMCGHQFSLDQCSIFKSVNNSQSYHKSLAQLCQQELVKQLQHF